MIRSSGSDGNWIKEEISKGADFGDLRLNKRFTVLASELASRPSLPINHATIDWASAKAAYRFFDNPKVQPSKILEPHFLSTEKRMTNYDRIVVVQDSSAIDFSSRKKTEGLGFIGQTVHHQYDGLTLHTAMAFTDKGLPLGLIYHSMYGRKYQTIVGHEHTKLPRKLKESNRWFEALDKTECISKKTQVVMVCDREADIYELFDLALDRGTDLIVRLSHNRVLYSEELDYLKIYDRLGLEKIQSQVEIDIPSSGSRKARSVNLDLRFCEITLASQPRGIKTSQTKHRMDMDLWVVDLRESNPPKGEEAIAWTLITTMEIRNIKQAKQAISYYKMRWSIELYFKCLKTGCGIEDCRLNHGDKLKKYISLLSIVAWRILWMTFINRTDPTLSCEVALTTSEWKTLWFKKNQRRIKSGELKPKPPKSPPTVYESLRWIAGLGGFLGRKSDGEPGLITIWRGWLELIQAVEMYELLHKN
jgi:hypothetical protein